jgi:hypothetical protein
MTVKPSLIRAAAELSARLGVTIRIEGSVSV